MKKKGYLNYQFHDRDCSLLKGWYHAIATFENNISV